MEIPSLVHFDQQVAGHDKLMLMSTNDLIVVKPCKKRELDFYQDALNFPDFQDFIPECYGTVRAATEKELKLLDTSELEGDSTLKLETSQNSHQNLCLENVLHGFTKPCILDLKMGSLLYDADATEEKRNRMIQHSLTTTSSILGLRISGLKVYDTIEKRYATYAKQFGKSRTAENSTEALLCYLFPTSTYAKDAQEYITYTSADNNDKLDTASKSIPPKYSKWVIECFIDTIIEIRDAIIEFANLRLIGSSLLFIYEGDAAAADKTWKHMLEEDSSNSPKGNNKEGQIDEEEEGEGELVPKMCDLRLIDFAHSDWHAERKEQDPELIQGFDNIIKILEDCLERQRQEKL